MTRKKLQSSVFKRIASSCKQGKYRGKRSSGINRKPTRFVSSAIIHDKGEHISTHLDKIADELVEHFQSKLGPDDVIDIRSVKLRTRNEDYSSKKRTVIVVKYFTSAPLNYGKEYLKGDFAIKD